MVVLTRADIINGVSEPKEVFIKLLNETISLRPLSDGEYAEVQAIKKDIGKIETNVSLTDEGELNTDKTIKNAKKRYKEFKKSSLKDLKIDLDMKKTEEANYQADCKAAAYGLSIQETFFSHDVAKMRPVGVVKEIADAVIRISKLEDPKSLKEDMEDFRE